jgi:hypothetical protein
VKNIGFVLSAVISKNFFQKRIFLLTDILVRVKEVPFYLGCLTTGKKMASLPALAVALVLFEVRFAVDGDGIWRIEAF